MEIKSNMVMCPNGHSYNAAIYTSCPFCSGKTVSFDGAPGAAFSGTIDFSDDAGKAGSFEKTIAPGAGGEFNGGFGNFNATSAPTMGPAGGYYGGAGGAEAFDNPTMIGGDIRSGGDQTDPVVGWLVCIDGPVRGTDFRLHAGYNYIGREIGDVHIHGDLQISRQNHAMIAFDSSEGCYYVGPSAGRNLIKVNGKTVLNAVEIKNYDVLSIGTTKLMFVALCGEHFGWNREDHA